MILPALGLSEVALGVDDAREHFFELYCHQHAGLSIAFNVDQLNVSMTMWSHCLMLRSDEWH